jgi:1-deoxy-D-xylulose 5-phosphate reductoisomerase
LEDAQPVTFLAALRKVGQLCLASKAIIVINGERVTMLAQADNHRIVEVEGRSGQLGIP